MTVQQSNNPISLGIILLFAGWLCILISIITSAVAWLPLVGIGLLISALKFS